MVMTFRWTWYSLEEQTPVPLKEKPPSSEDERGLGPVIYKATKLGWSKDLGSCCTSKRLRSAGQ
jgi:hypothetical protein